MKIRLFVALLCPFLIQCTTYYKIFGDRNTFYTEQEKKIHKRTTKSIDFDYGFDVDMKLNYVFPISKGYTKFNVNEKDFIKAIEGVDTVSLIAYNEKIYYLKKITLLKMEEYKRFRQWKYYTFIKKYLLPPLNSYRDLLERKVLERDELYKKKIKERKRAIDKKLKKEIKRLEFEELWENDYNS